jgi:hypothetical protein
MSGRSYRLRCKACMVAALLPLLMWSTPSAAQQRFDRSGVVLYWGLVPAAVVAHTHDVEELHGGVPKAGGEVHQLVVALFDMATGRRIDDTVVRTQVSEIGIPDAAPKYLAPMKINEQVSYGQAFGMDKEDPYRFKVRVRLAQRQEDIEFAFSAWSPDRAER